MMSARIRIIYRIIRTVYVQMPLSRVIHFPSITILADESAVCRVIVSCIHIVQACCFIVDGTGVTYFIVNGFNEFSYFAKVRIFVCRFCAEAAVCNAFGTSLNVLVVDIIVRASVGTNGILVTAKNICCSVFAVSWFSPL